MKEMWRQGRELSRQAILRHLPGFFCLVQLDNSSLLIQETLAMEQNGGGGELQMKVVYLGPY